MKDSMLQRIKKRRDDLDVYYNRLVKQIEMGVLGGEEDRLFLDKFAQGNCLDIACGDFVIEGAIGIDGDHKKIGADYFLLSGTELTQIEAGSLDSLVCNYLDCLDHPLIVLASWSRVLRQGGILALAVRNSEAYSDKGKGPLDNNRRIHLFSPKILTFYLRRAGFEPFKTETEDTSLRIAAKKL